jgi:uncharacterized protein (UPF0548 family)
MITKTRKQIGSGQDAYKAAVAAIKGWAHLQLGELMSEIETKAAQSHPCCARMSTATGEHIAGSGTCFLC